MFAIEITSDLESLLANSDAWNQLTRGVPFRQAEWIGPWWKHFGRNAEAFVLLARDRQGETRGILPLYRRRGPTGGHTLRIMGDGSACSDHVSVLCHASDQDEISSLIGWYLASSAGCSRWGWDLLDIDGFVEGDAAMAALVRGLKSGGAALHASSRMSTWSKPADASWEDHLRCYGKTQRRKMRRWGEEIWPQGPLRRHTARTPEDVSIMLNQLIEMHQRRWTSAGQAGSFAEPRFRQFLLDSAQQFLKRGQLYLTSLESSATPLAAELSFVGGNHILYVYTAGFDTNRAELEPGRILSVDTLQHLYRASLNGIDYLRGDEEYKKRYTTESHRLIRLRAVAPTLLPRIRHAAWRTRFQVKQWLRQTAGRPPVAIIDLSKMAGPALRGEHASEA